MCMISDQEYAMSEFRRIYDQYRTPVRLAGIGGALLIAAGCAANSTAEVPPAATTIAQPQDSAQNEFEPRITYLPNGTFILKIVDTNPDDSSDAYTDNIYGSCHGKDLVEQGQAYGSGRSSTIERSPDHPACADGRLTQEDFPAPAPVS
jgi:hypothetical protein